MAPIAQPDSPITWRREDGAIGPLNVCSILERDVAGLLHDPRPEQVLRNRGYSAPDPRPWLLEYGRFWDHARRFAVEGDAYVFLERNRVEIHEMSLPPD